METPYLVPGRECGACLVCCTELEIVDPELTKPAGKTCCNAIDGGGCRIYETRPQACRAFFCGWRQIPVMSDELRPDRSGVLVRFTKDDVPERFNGKLAITALPLSRASLLIEPHVLDLFAKLHVAGWPIFIFVAGVKILLNDYIEHIDFRGDTDQVILETGKSICRAITEMVGVDTEAAHGAERVIGPNEPVRERAPNLFDAMEPFVRNS